MHEVVDVAYLDVQLSRLAKGIPPVDRVGHMRLELPEVRKELRHPCRATQEARRGGAVPVAEHPSENGIGPDHLPAASIGIEVEGLQPILHRPSLAARSIMSWSSSRAAISH